MEFGATAIAAVTQNSVLLCFLFTAHWAVSLLWEV